MNLVSTMTTRGNRIDTMTNKNGLTEGVTLNGLVNFRLLLLAITSSNETGSTYNREVYQAQIIRIETGVIAKRQRSNCGS